LHSDACSLCEAVFASLENAIARQFGFAADTVC